MRKPPKSRKCRVQFCHELIPPYRHFCPTHWFRIPTGMRDEIGRAYDRRDLIAVGKLAFEATKIIEGGDHEKARQQREKHCG